MMDLRARGCYHGDRAMHGITTLQHMPKRAAAALAIALTLAGGVVETTTLAPYYGGHLEPIMVAQTTRVALIVVFAPFLVISFVGGGVQNPLLGVPVVPWLPILGLVLVSGIIATLLSRTRSPNA